MSQAILILNIFLKIQSTFISSNGFIIKLYYIINVVILIMHYRYQYVFYKFVVFFLLLKTSERSARNDIAKAILMVAKQSTRKKTGRCGSCRSCGSSIWIGPTWSLFHDREPGILLCFIFIITTTIFLARENEVVVRP